MELTKLKLAEALALAVSLAVGAAALVYQAHAGSQADAGKADRPKSAQKAATRQDRYGDPLPPGAVARMGTVRFRNASWVRAIACSPDGKRLAVEDGRIVRLWDATTGKELGQFRGHESLVRCLAYSPDGRHVASRSNDNTILLWDTATTKELRRLKGHHDAPALGYDMGAQVIFSPDAKTLISRGGDNAILLWDVATGRELRQFKGYRDHVWTIALAADGKTLAAFSKKPNSRAEENKPGEVRLWDLATGDVLRQWLLADDLCFEVFSPDLKTLVTKDRSGADTSRVKLLDVAEGRQVTSLPGTPYAVAFSADSRTLVLAEADFIRLWDVAAGKELRRVKNHGAYHPQIALCPDGKTLLSWGWSRNTVYFWDLATGRELCHFEGHESEIRGVAFSPDGKLLASGEAEEIRLWDVAAAKEVRRIKGHVSFLIGLAFSPDGKILVSVSANRVIHLWETATGRELRRFQGDMTTTMAFSADAKTLATWVDWPIGGVQKNLRLWNVTTGKEMRQLNPTQQWISCLAFSPDGRTLAADGGTDIHVWDVASGHELRPIGKHPNAITRVAFSPDGHTLAGVSWFGTIHLWEVATGLERRVINTGGNVTSVVFSPDGRFLVSANDGSYTSPPDAKKEYPDNEDKDQVRLWDLASGEEIHHFGSHRGGITVLAFSPEGKLLATGSHDTTVLLWDFAGALKRARPQRAKLQPKDLEALWAELSGGDAARAYRATWTLAAGPDQSLPFLKEHVRPVPAADPQQVARLLIDLDSNEFVVRKKATQELENLGAPARPALRKALLDRPSLEVRRRLEHLLEKPIENGPLHALRAVEVLEHITNPDARQLLQTLAKGVPDARLTQEAKASLERLAKRPASPSER